jgi:uncharacterized membrane protein YhiD involved in acid resistance
MIQRFATKAAAIMRFATAAASARCNFVTSSIAIPPRGIPYFRCLVGCHDLDRNKLELLDPDLFWPIIGAIVASAIVGAEREYRASPAGLRTHVLVGLSCCLLMLSAVHQMAWLSDAPVAVVRIDPVRMAHGILTGIGFLCGGAIFREGFNVRGLTTAASLWMTATLGILFGIGFYELAIFAATATVLGAGRRHDHRPARSAAAHRASEGPLSPVNGHRAERLRRAARPTTSSDPSPSTSR